MFHLMILFLIFICVFIFVILHFITVVTFRLVKLELLYVSAIPNFYTHVVIYLHILLQFIAMIIICVSYHHDY